jgi:hypothetical protein
MNLRKFQIYCEMKG